MSRLAAVLLLLLSAGCESCGAQGGEGEAVTGPASASEGQTGVVEGVVRLAAGAELPSRPAPPAEPGRPEPPEACGPPRLTDRQPVQVGEGRGLSNIVVAAAEFDGDVPHEPETHAVAIRECRLDPPLVAATRGDVLLLSNETDHPFLPRMGNGAFMQMLQRGDSRRFELLEGGVRDLNCGFSTGCGGTDIIVFYHPVHTVTGDGGRFRIDNVPPGEDLEIHAWHPLFAEASAHVTVVAGETAQVELTLTVAPPSVPAEPAPTAGEGGAEAPPSGEPAGGRAEDRPELF